MRVEMTIPDLSTTGGTVRVIQWLVEPGQAVKRGQAILEVETDKSTMEVESYLSGVLLEVLAEPDTDVEVGQAIAVIETEEDAAPGPKPADGKPEIAAGGRALAQPLAQAVAPEAPRPGGMFARNRQRAAQGAEAPATAAPETAARSSPAIPPALPMTTAQRVTAQRMLESKQTIPHFYLQTSANAGPMLRRRAAALTGEAGGEKLAWDAFFVYAVGKALQKYERMRYSFIDGQLVPPETEAVGVAVDLDDDLYVVRIGHPAAKTPETISGEIRAWVQRLRQGDPEARKLGRANLTITNLGATGVEAFTAVINPPEASILAIGKVAPAAAVEGGQVVIQDRVSLTLSVDHRVVNGRYAAEFLQAVVAELEAL